MEGGHIEEMEPVVQALLCRAGELQMGFVDLRPWSGVCGSGRDGLGLGD